MLQSQPSFSQSELPTDSRPESETTGPTAATVRLRGPTLERTGGVPHELSGSLDYTPPGTTLLSAASRPAVAAPSVDGTSLPDHAVRE